MSAPREGEQPKAFNLVEKSGKDLEALEVEQAGIGPERKAGQAPGPKYQLFERSGQDLDVLEVEGNKQAGKAGVAGPAEAK